MIIVFISKCSVFFSFKHLPTFSSLLFFPNTSYYVSNNNVSQKVPRVLIMLLSFFVYLFFVCSLFVLMTLLCGSLFFDAFCCFGWWTNVWHGFIRAMPAKPGFSVHFFRGICVWFCQLLHITSLLTWDYLKLIYLLGVSRTSLIMQFQVQICFRENLCVWIHRGMYFVFYLEPKPRHTSFLLSPFSGEHIFSDYPFRNYSPPRMLVYREASDPTLHFMQLQSTVFCPKWPFKHKHFGHYA